MLVVITRGRVGAQHTISNLPKQLLDDTYLCCPKDEIPGHIQNGITNFLEEPLSFPMDYGQKFQWLLEGADSRLPKKFIILDDDLRFSQRDPSNPKRLIQASEEAKLEGFGMIYALLDQFPHIGMHPRAMGQNTDPNADWKIDTRINAVHGINRDLLGGLRADEMPILNDIILALKILIRGDGNAVTTKLFWDQCTGSNAPGGCSIHRTWEQQKECVLRLHHMFPQFVKVQQKAPKSGWWKDEEGNPLPRYDFMVQWKKAAEYGRANRA